MNRKIADLLVMFRNGLAFSFAWLVIVIVAIALITGTVAISTAILAKLLVLCIGAAILFALAFSSAIFKKQNFIKRLTFLVLTFIPLEVAIFYWMGLFQGAGTATQWFVFVGIILIMYVTSLLIDATVYANRGKEYTSQLNEYKKRRLTYNESESNQSGAAAE